jgi:hypothetical protein
VWTGPFVGQPGRQLIRSGCMRVMPPGTASANSSAAPADSGFHRCTRKPRF